MKIYIYYSKKDSSQEPLNKIWASDYNEALLIFAQTKKLTISNFLNIYSVKEYK
jgi:hypothetical protein